MKISTASFEAAFQRKRQQRGGPSLPAKRARVSAGGAAAPAVPTAARLSEEKPPVVAAPKPVGAGIGEGEVPAATEPTVVVLDEEEAPAAAEVPEAGQASVVEESPAAAVPVAASPPAAAAPGAESASPAAEGGRQVVRRPRPRAEAAGRRGGEPGGSSRQATRPPTRPPTDGREPESSPHQSTCSPTRHLAVPMVRPAPVLTSMSDAGAAAGLLQRLRTDRSDAELRGLSHSALLDSAMVANLQVSSSDPSARVFFRFLGRSFRQAFSLQAANVTVVLREAMVHVSEALSKAIARGEKYKRESAERAQNMARLQEEAQARERSLGNKVMEAEGLASFSVAKIDSAQEKQKAAEARVEELTRQLRGAAEAARVAAERATALEKEVAEANAEKAGALACTDEACVRAREAEDKAWEAEVRAKEAEARAEKAEVEAGRQRPGRKRPRRR